MSLMRLRLAMDQLVWPDEVVRKGVATSWRLRWKICGRGLREMVMGLTVWEDGLDLIKESVEVA